MPEDSGVPVPAPTRVLLADDHSILRQGLRMLLDLHRGIQVVGEAGTGREAVALSHDLAPDVVILDITMPDMDGLEACRLIRREQPATQVLMLTMHESEEYFLQALRMGATGYLVKKAAPGELHMAITTIAAGGAYLYPGLARALIRAYVNPDITTTLASRSASLTRELRVLTPRELEVLQLVAEGLTNQEIADQLILSIKTVQAHRANVMDKLGLSDITHLVRFALRHGLITPEP